MSVLTRTSCFAFAGLLLGCVTAQTAPRGGWELLGQRDVDFRVDHDVIEVGRAEGRFRELRFEAHGGDIEVYNLRVILTDGESVSPRGRLVLERGEGRTMDLPGNRRSVRRVEFTYRTLHGRGRHATVLLYGR